MHSFSWFLSKHVNHLRTKYILCERVKYLQEEIKCFEGFSWWTFLFLICIIYFPWSLCRSDFPTNLASVIVYNCLSCGISCSFLGEAQLCITVFVLWWIVRLWLCVCVCKVTKGIRAQVTLVGRDYACCSDTQSIRHHAGAGVGREGGGGLPVSLHNVKVKSGHWVFVLDVSPVSCDSFVAVRKPAMSHARTVCQKTFVISKLTLT